MASGTSFDASNLLVLCIRNLLSQQIVSNMDNKVDNTRIYLKDVPLSLYTIKIQNFFTGQMLKRRSLFRVKI